MEQGYVYYSTTAGSIGRYMITRLSGAEKGAALWWLISIALLQRLQGSFINHLSSTLNFIKKYEVDLNFNIFMKQ
jgi:hypothetical protein